MNISEQLDMILDTLQSKGFRPNLNPGLSEQELEELQQKFGFHFPPQLKSLYRWRNGCKDPYAEIEESFNFRDMPFLSADASYSELEGLRQFIAGFEMFGSKFSDFELDKVVPIAAFDGAWYVVPVSSHKFADVAEHPVVSVGEETAVHFLSIETMLLTTLEWVRDPEYTVDEPEPADEIVAWEKHNPGVLDNAEY